MADYDLAIIGGGLNGVSVARDAAGRGFFRVRRALAERDIWLRTAPHLVRPQRFVIPAHSDERPSWLL